MLTRQDVAAAAPVWARDVLAASSRATVTHAGADAVYLDTGSDVIAVVSRRAVHVPCALQTTLTSMAELSADRRLPRPGTPVPISDGRILIGDQRIVIGRMIDYRAPAIDARAAATMAARLTPAARTLTAPILHELPPPALGSLLRAETRAADDLIGLGSGLTPLGDDVICGWLATLTAAAHPCAGPVSDRVLRTAGTRTTKLSATLLRRAIAGDVVPQFCDVIHALTSSEPGGQRVDDSVRALAEIGHTSGAGLTLGLSIALDHLATRSYCP